MDVIPLKEESDDDGHKRTFTTYIHIYIYIYIYMRVCVRVRVSVEGPTLSRYFPWVALRGQVRFL